MPSTFVTTTAKGELSYHFICNYCGRRCNRTVSVVGNAYGGRENAGGALRDLQNEANRYRERIRAYKARLRAGNALPGKKYDPVDYSVNSLLMLGMDGTCIHCGKVQAWAIDPSSHEDSLRRGCLGVLACVLLGLAVFLIGAVVRDATAEAVLMILGVCVALLGGTGCLIASSLRKRRYTKKKLAELAAAPNDPEKLPVIDA